MGTPPLQQFTFKDNGVLKKSRNNPLRLVAKIALARRKIHPFASLKLQVG
jgi:hypothetical protein